MVNPKWESPKLGSLAVWGSPFIAVFPDRVCLSKLLGTAAPPPLDTEQQERRVEAALVMPCGSGLGVGEAQGTLALPDMGSPGPTEGSLPEDRCGATGVVLGPAALSLIVRQTLCRLNGWVRSGGAG